MKNIIIELLYINWKFYNKGKIVKKFSKFNYYFGLVGRVTLIIYFIFLILLAILFPKYLDDIASLAKANKLKFIILFFMITLPINLLIYRQYKKYESDFIEKQEKEKQYIKEFKEKLNKDPKTDKFEENIPKEKYCIDCKRPFSEVKRFENTNLCEKCFNKELSDDSKSNENQQQVFH